jgi:hypothetical protein
MAFAYAPASARQRVSHALRARQRGLHTLRACLDILQTVGGGLETVKKNILPQSRRRKE